MRVLSIAIVYLSLTACTQPSASTPEEKAVEELLMMYYKDFSERDWQKFRSHFWSDATLTTAWQQPGDSVVRVDVTTINDFIKEAPNGPDSQPIFEERMVRWEIRTNNNLAEAWVDYHAKFGTTGKLSEWDGKDLFTFMRHDGEWRIVSLVFEAE
jgi:hypothetical protein